MDGQQNGSASTIEDADIIEAVQRRIDQRQARVIEIETELVEHRAQLKRDEKVVALLRGEEASKKPGPKPRQAASQKGIGDDLLAGIEAAVRRYADGHEEFRQVDIRKMPDTPTDKSSVMATAFDHLRERNVIRFVRQEGISKVYRLTRETVVAES
jgi:hypothetical protein